MDMLPIFILGLIIGAGVTAIIMANLKNIPSTIRLASLEEIIISLKDDIKILEDTNQDLQKKLKDAKAKLKKENEE